MKSQETSGTSGEESKAPRYSLEQLNAALLDTFDLMQRCVLDTTFVVIGEAAKCLYENRGLDCNGLDFAIERRYVTPEVTTTLKDWVKGLEMNESGFNYIFEGVPIRFKYIEGKYDYFKYADIKIYGPEIYKIPNPFNAYYKERDLIV